jgi:hypothetical protein
MTIPNKYIDGIYKREEVDRRRAVNNNYDTGLQIIITPFTKTHIQKA